METVATAAGYPHVDAVAGERSSSAVSWAAIVAGAVVAAATSLLLITLGAGVGLSTLSPWPNTGTSATTFAVTTAIGLIVVQWLSAAVGGYIAGRMRTKWASLHTHEVFFRDTAHGFITWAAATLLVVWAAASISGGALGAGVHAAATVGSGAAAGATTAATGTGGVDPYEVDTLLRPASPTAAAANNDARGGNDPRPQVTRILGKVLATDQIRPKTKPTSLSWSSRRPLRHRRTRRHASTTPSPRSSRPSCRRSRRRTRRVKLQGRLPYSPGSQC